MSDKSSDVSRPPGSPFSANLKGLKRLRTDGAHSDFTLVAGSKEWKVHKIVLSMHSDVLYKMSISENFVECKTGRAELKDVNGDPFSAECIEALTQYMYESEDHPWPWHTKHYDQWGECKGFSVVEEEPDSATSEPQLEGVAKAAWLALMDDMPTTKRRYDGECVRHESARIDFLFKILDLAEMYNIQPLRSSAISSIIDIAYCEMPGKLEFVIDRMCTADTTPEELREGVVRYAARNVGKFYPLEDSGVLHRHPQFREELFAELIRCDHVKMKREREKERRKSNAWGNAPDGSAFG